MKNSERFIKLCNTLNMILVRTYRLAPHATLGQAIRHTKQLDVVINRFYDVLIDYTDLRNVLIHSQLTSGYLAEPSDAVIQTLTHVIDRIEKPKRIKDYFLSHVETLHMKMTLLDVLHIIKDKRYSHYPVYEGQMCVGILTDNGIVHYLADHFVDRIDYPRILVSELLHADDNSQAYAFISLEMTTLEVFDRFKSETSQVRALLIVADLGDQTKKQLKGMVLPKDLYQVIGDMLEMK